MTDDGRDKPTREFLADLLRPAFPPKAKWQLVLDESATEDSNRTRVRITQRSIARSRTGDASMHVATMHVTITVPGDSPASAEARLDDDMHAFLYALDEARLAWGEAVKSRFDDEQSRLGYSLDIELITTPNEEKA